MNKAMDNIIEKDQEAMPQKEVLSPVARHHRNERGKFFLLRNILNLIFIIGAIVGMFVYFFRDEEVGIVIVLGSMSFKMCECVIRLIK